MKNSLASKWQRLWRGTVADLLHDRRGLAAVEFAMILPVMLVTLFGLIGVTSAISINRKVTLISRTLSDLTSQGTTVDDGKIANFFAIGKFMLTPYSATANPFSGGPLLQTISEVYVDPATSAVRVQWSKGDVPRAIGSPVPEMPTNLIGKDATQKTLPNQYFILSEVSYSYAPSILPGVASVSLKQVTYTRPRTSTPVCVQYAPLTAADACTTK